MACAKGDVTMSLFPGPYGEYAMVIIYVDDILSTTNNEELKGNMFEQLDQNYGLSESRTIQLIIGYTGGANGRDQNSSDKIL